ncbi:OB-fold domain-containing protein [Roseomonas sp. OT10]|uniref:Zn-ribbon domain-containing OB-fold protein n=1 Tax=Roseomonas cutis TaxID=2897332 RepID=UPI001E393EA6|nr:OB-fold domain-containing protein [Roseomonas sp. OT10]UFN50103.1 OB-fold domain-containing protein [Roseomonas sp. OT10]
MSGDGKGGGPVSVGIDLPEAGLDAATAFWAHLAAGELRLQYDPGADRCQFYPRPLSLFAPDGSLEWRAVPRTGTLLALTMVRTPTPGFPLPPPYRVGLVRLDAGPRLFGVVEAEAAPAIGSRVELVPPEAAKDVPPLRFRPVAAAGA